MRDDREAGRGEERLHHRFVHADRRSEDARPHVRDVRELEEPLHRAVLAVRTVQNREDDIEAGARDGG